MHMYRVREFGALHSFFLVEYGFHVYNIVMEHFSYLFLVPKYQPYVIDQCWDLIWSVNRVYFPKKKKKKYIKYFFSFEVRNKLNMKNFYNTSNAEEID